MEFLSTQPKPEVYGSNVAGEEVVFRACKPEHGSFDVVGVCSILTLYHFEAQLLIICFSFNSVALIKPLDKMQLREKVLISYYNSIGNSLCGGIKTTVISMSIESSQITCLYSAQFLHSYKG